MRHPDFAKLDSMQQLALLIAMHVRNQMEDFHVEHLSDSQMKALNPIIRQAIYDMLIMTHTEPRDKKEEQSRKKEIDWLIMMIPDYWEIPGKARKLKSSKN